MNIGISDIRNVQSSQVVASCVTGTEQNAQTPIVNVLNIYASSIRVSKHSYRSNNAFD